MLREAYLLYQMFVLVFRSTDISWTRSLLLCYGVPLVIVAVSAVIRWNDYGTASNCWLSTRHGTIYAFIGPVLFVIAINLLAFIRILFSIMRLGRLVKTRRSCKEDFNRHRQLKQGVRASISFLCLLGVTWIFGALAIGQAAVAFFYLFAVCHFVSFNFN